MPDDVDAVFQRASTGGYLHLLTKEHCIPSFRTLCCIRFHSPSGQIFFIKGNEYYRVTDKYLVSASVSAGKDRVDPGFPRKLQETFLGVPDHIDAAFVGDEDNVIYFLSGSTAYAMYDSAATETPGEVISFVSPTLVRDCPNKWVETRGKQRVHPLTIPLPKVVAYMEDLMLKNSTLLSVKAAQLSLLPARAFTLPSARS